MIGLGTLGGTESAGMAINRTGQIAGSSALSGNERYRAFLWNPSTANGTTGAMVELGALEGVSSYGRGINSLGEVVGRVEDDWAFIWRPTTPNGSTGSLIDLNTLIDPISGWTLMSAEAINDVGQIVGSGLYNGQYVVYLLTPIPEPTTAALLLTVFAGVHLTVRRRGRRR
jgi:uncharacterized membrane protein